MPGRKFSAGSGYRYWFNGKENDKETTATSTYDYGFRIYSPGLGRFLSVDPLTKSYPWNSPFAFAENDVIRSIDLDGLEKFIVVNTLDRFGRTTMIKVESIITVRNGAPIDQDFKYNRGKKDLTEKNIYLQYMRNGGFCASDASRNGGLTADEQLAYSTTIKVNNGSSSFDQENGITDAGAEELGSSFTTQSGRQASSLIKGSVEGVTHNYKEGQRSFARTAPVRDRSGINADWVSSTLVNGEPSGATGGLPVGETGTGLSKNINDFISNFKRQNNVNVAFVDNITITLNNNVSRTQWNEVAANLRAAYNTTVLIQINPNIQKSDTGGATQGAGSDTYANVQYRVSGVRDGNANLAAPGNR